ncbi:hypothetical protein HS125_15625 [bacterium]|nr:hypothetical protein [bacterium]
MKMLLTLIVIAVVLLVGVPIVLGLLGAVAGLVLKLVGLFLVLAIPILLVVLVLKCLARLLGDGRKEAKELPDDPQYRALGRRLARLDRRMERIEEILQP